MENTQEILNAILLTGFAGLATGIGSLISLTAKKTNTNYLSFSLGLSAGVMIYVSFVELFSQSGDILKANYGDNGELYNMLAFIGGVLFIAIIDKLIPENQNPHEFSNPNKRLYRTGIISAIVIAIHNFPEGIATFMTALYEPSLGVPIAIAIAIHNIPEGIVVYTPLYYSTGNKKKAFWLSLLSGLAEPLGGIIAYLVVMPFFHNHDLVLAYILSFVAGIMVFISLDELLPAAREYGKHHSAVYGLVLGMFIMGLSLFLL
ncbi:MAG: zinc transporter ZupT [Bacteroidales bacterium]|nr:zinc transporter ZupT [Bacteroidales bacterium]